MDPGTQTISSRQGLLNFLALLSPAGFFPRVSFFHKSGWLAWLTVLKLFVQTMWFLLNTCFSSWESRILICARQRVSTWSILSESPGVWVSSEFPWYATLYKCCHNSFLWKLSIFCVILLGEDSWKRPGFLWILFHALFPFADFVW